MYCRAKDRYRRFRGDMIDTGASRRVSVWSGNSLTEEWTGSPSALITPDEKDSEMGFRFIYGMPVQKYGGVYFGTPWMFRMNDIIVPQTGVSAGMGLNTKRLHHRPALISLGEEGTWGRRLHRQRKTGSKLVTSGDSTTRLTMVRMGRENDPPASAWSLKRESDSFRVAALDVGAL